MVQVRAAFGRNCKAVHNRVQCADEANGSLRTRIDKQLHLALASKSTEMLAVDFLESFYSKKSLNDMEVH